MTKKKTYDNDSISSLKGALSLIHISGPCDDRHGGHPAEAAAVGLGALRPAPTGADAVSYTHLG